MCDIQRTYLLHLKCPLSSAGRLPYSKSLNSLHGVGLTLIIRTGLFVDVVEYFEVIATHFIAGEDIGDEFQERGLSDTSLSNKKDGVWRSNLVL
jgi:hypothetical protein